MREGLSPIPDDDSLTDKHAAVIEAASEKFDSHLLCHSDCEGMYVPIDFAEPIFDEDLPGVLLGSSHALLRELHSLASHIGIEFSEGRPTRACEAELQDPDYDGSFTTERVVWYAMWEAATMSIQYRTAITFE
ncbi:MAG: hypothetical protein KDC95_22070 [Planctomycetes bacterium]|nr:hypothetical protein [Planctomycetota bacterium]